MQMQNHNLLKLVKIFTAPLDSMGQ